MRQMSYKTIAVFFSLLTIASCSDNTGDNGSGSDSDTASGVKRIDKAQKVFFTVPSPIEMGNLLRKSKASYDSKILNPVENLSGYSTSEMKAVNLGVYGTDMSLASIFGQSQETAFYLKCVSKLAKDLGIERAFDQELGQRIEANIDEKDSLLKIIAQAYWESDAYLKADGRQNISGLIVAGGWIEGLHVASQIAVKTKNAEIIERIGEQKLSLDNLIGLLESYKAEGNSFAILDDLKTLNAIYEKVEYTKSKAEARTDASQKLTVISGSSKVIVTPEQLTEIRNKIEEIRNKII